MKEFKGKVAVITGAASRIGRGIAQRCVSEGMKVVLADISDVNLARAETELQALGGTVLGVRTDVPKRSEVERLARHTLDAFGQVHLLVNNAGVGAGGSPWEATWNDWERQPVGGDPQRQGVHTSYAGSECRVPYRQYGL